MENIVSGSGNLFLVYTNKYLGDWGRSEEKRRYAVNSKQKSTKNLFLAGSFLTCWLAGPFYQYLPLSNNDFEDGGRINRILVGNVVLGDRIVLGGTGSAFLVYTKDLGGGGRSEEKRRCAVNSKQKLTKNLFLAGSILRC